MNIRIKGTFRHRVRVNLLIFWIVEKWKTDKFEHVIPVPIALEKEWTVGPVPIKVKVAPIDGGASVEISAFNVKAFAAEIPIDVKPFNFEAEPIKGCQLKATVSLEQ